MQRIGLYMVMAVVCCGMFSALEAYSRYTHVQIGPQWPEDLKGVAWNAGLESGAEFDQIITVGGGLNFLWKTEVSDSEDVSTTPVTKIDTSKTGRYMVPVYATLGIDPQPQLIVHPVLKIDVGLNTMYYSHREYDRDKEKLVKADTSSGFYFGPFVRVGLEGVYDLGETVSARAGCSWSWSKVKKNAENAGHYERPMSGFGMCVGLRFRM